MAVSEEERDFIRRLVLDQLTWYERDDLAYQPLRGLALSSRHLWVMSRRERRLRVCRVRPDLRKVFDAAEVERELCLPERERGFSGPSITIGVPDIEHVDPDAVCAKLDHIHGRSGRG